MRLDFKMSGEIIFWYICNHIFSQHKYVPCPFSNWIHRAATWIQLVKCVPDIERHPLLYHLTSSTSPLAGSICICKQLFSRMKYTKRKARNKISDHRELRYSHQNRCGCRHFSIQFQISHSFYGIFFYLHNEKNL